MLLTVYACFKILLNVLFTKMNAQSRKRIFFWCYWILIACKWKLLWRIWISQDVNESLETLLNVYNYADIFIEGAFRAIECRLAHMNVFSHYCLTFSADDCLFSLNDIQKVWKINLGALLLAREWALLSVPFWIKTLLHILRPCWKCSWKLLPFQVKVSINKVFSVVLPKGLFLHQEKNTIAPSLVSRMLESKSNFSSSSCSTSTLLSFVNDYFQNLISFESSLAASCIAFTKWTFPCQGK